MTLHTPIPQQRLLLQFVAAAYRPQTQFRLPVTRIRSSCALLQGHQSPRWRHQSRNFSTSPKTRQQIPPQEPFPTYFQDSPLPSTPSQLPTQLPPPPPPPPEPKRNVTSRFLFAFTFFFLGNLAGGLLERFANPAPPVSAGSHLDDLQRQRIHHLASKLDVVQALEADPDWVSWDAYASLPAEQRRRHLVASSLSAADALGAYQRAYQNLETGEVLVLVYFGRAATGWPTVVHGGALATVLDETCGRVAFARLGGFEQQQQQQQSPGGREEGPAAGQRGRGPVVTAWLKLDYLAMTKEREFYLVGARVKEEEELEEEERGKRGYKAYVQGWVESVSTGEETVVAEALFVAPKPKKREKVTVAAEVGTGRPPILPPDQRW